MSSRGLRNRNPGNIRISECRFKGEVVPSIDPSFKQFRGEAWGYRAIFVILNTYRVKHKLNTLREMINRWAPPSENKTENYVEYVARTALVDADIPLDTLHRETMLPIVAAMSQMENGVKADWAAVERGWDLFEASA
ncbi:MAG: structural protein P5 [Rikenellaceae bacterium]